MHTSARQPAWPPSHWDVKQKHPVENMTCVKLVLDAYTNAMKGLGRQDAFNTAVRVWRERNPNASPEMAGPAVATILAKKP